MNVLITLGSNLGTDLGPDFLITTNSGIVTPSSVTRTELLVGITVAVDDNATELYIESQGVCSTILTLSISELPITTTTSTTMSPVAICLDGLILETIYLHIPEDILLLPEGYTHPCQDQINLHFCNRALFEVFGNGVYIADSRMNNEGGSGGGVTSHGTNICEDYHNVPDILVGGIWTGNTQARYNRTIITQEQAIAIAAAGGEISTIDFSLVAAMTTYNATCDANINPHSNITWVRISELNGTVLYNGCPEGNFVTIDVCPDTTTTTTTEVPTTTTSTTTTEEITTTTTTTIIEALSLELTFDDIANANIVVGDSSDVSDWNTFFDLPTNGGEFTNVYIVGNIVTLYGGSGITLKNDLFRNKQHLINFRDNSGICENAGNYCFQGCIGLVSPDFSGLETAGISCFQSCPGLVDPDFSNLITAGDYCFNNDIGLYTPNFSSLQTAGINCFNYCPLLATLNFGSLVTAGEGCFDYCEGLIDPDFSSLTTAGDYCFDYCTGLTTPDFTSLVTIGNYCFMDCDVIETIYIPSCTALGSTTSINSVFSGILGQTITLTIPAALMTCNGGLADGDILYLQANNTVTIIQV